MALDPSYFFYSEGTISLTNGSDIATGEFTAWDPAVLPFDFVFPNNGTDGMTVIKDVLAMDQIQLAQPWTGPTLTDVPYFMVRWTKHTDPKVYALRVSDYLARLKAIPDNIEEVAAGISTDAAAVAAALTALSQIEANVDADRAAAQTAAGTAATDASAANQARILAEAARDAAQAGSVADNAVTNVKLADMPTGRLKGRVTSGTGDPEDLTAAQVQAMIGASDYIVSVADIVSGAAFHDITLPAGYEYFEILISSFAMVADTFAKAQGANASGLITGNNYYETIEFTSAANAKGAGTRSLTALWQLSGSIPPTIPGLIRMTLFPGSAASFPHIMVDTAAYITALNLMDAYQSKGLINVNGRLTSLRLMANTGNLSKGRIVVRGVKQP